MKTRSVAVNKLDLDRDDMSISDDEDIGNGKEGMDWECPNKSDSEKGNHKNQIMVKTASRHPTNLRLANFNIRDWEGMILAIKGIISKPTKKP
eukprot:689547-Ditylum_brightwellii.AAC.1